MKYDKLIFELSKPGKIGHKLPKLDVCDKCIKELIPEDLLNDNDINLPEVSEHDVVRHFTNLSNKNFGVDTGFYPLGSCTMKYNPKINEAMASLKGFSGLHPNISEEYAQGALRLMYELGISLNETSGMDACTLQPAAGAHGEITSIMIFKAYHEHNGDFKRDKIIVPDSAHGTNPATASMAGYKIIEIKSGNDGLVDLEALKAAVGEDTAALMLTNPNTLGLFEHEIKAISKIVHDAGGLVYYDGANANAILGHVRPGDMGFDAIHYNLHKTFSTPHGGGGPGAGYVGCKDFLKEFLPVPIVIKEDEKYKLSYDVKHTIGKMKDFYGHFGILVRAYAYILALGSDGLKVASDYAVLNSNYLANRLKDDYNLPSNVKFKHEFTLAGLKNPNGLVTLDVAKRLIDMGYHPPTVYFPLIVNESMMIEPTETESKDTLDGFADALIEIAKEARENPQIVHDAPHNTEIKRPDETLAAKNLILKYTE